MKLRFLLTLFTTFFAYETYAQEPVIELYMTVNDDDLRIRMPGAVLIIKEDGKLYKSEISAANGKFPVVKLKLNHIYSIAVTKEGYVSKTCTISSFATNPEDLALVLYREIEVSIFRQIVGADFSFLETTPMAKFEITENGYVEFDPSYTREMLIKIEEIKRKKLIRPRNSPHEIKK